MDYLNYIQPQIQINKFVQEAFQYVGQQFGNIIILGINPIRRNSQIQFDVYCTSHPEIGIYQVLKGNILSGNTRGCYKCAPGRGHLANTKHGLSKSHEYYSYNRILNNIKDINNRDFHNYGGRGIDIDPRYDPDFNNQGREIGFLNFINDLKEIGLYPIVKGQTLDRIDNNKGYWKYNLRCITQQENNQNRRCNTITPDDVKNMRKDWSSGKFTQKELSKKYNCHKQTVYEVVNNRQWNNIK